MAASRFDLWTAFEQSFVGGLIGMAKPSLQRLPSSLPLGWMAKDKFVAMVTGQPICRPKDFFVDARGGVLVPALRSK
jgi:hypothetical protein